MSVNLSIKDVPDPLAARLRERAARHHRSLQGELMAIITQAAGEPDAAAPAWGTNARARKTVEQIVEEARQRFPGGTPNSVDLIREMRDTRNGPNADDDRER